MTDTKLAVPYWSQFTEELPEEWRPRACSIANVKMAMDFLIGERAPSIHDLLEEGITIGGFEEHGWKHDSLVFLFHNHGIHAYRQEFRSGDAATEEQLRTEGLEKIKRVIRDGVPVILSTTKGNGSYHTILGVGVTDDELTYHDSETKESLTIPYSAFMAMWRGLVIFPSL